MLHKFLYLVKSCFYQLLLLALWLRFSNAQNSLRPLIDTYLVHSYLDFRYTFWGYMSASRQNDLYFSFLILANILTDSLDSLLSHKSPISARAGPSFRLKLIWRLYTIRNRFCRHGGVSSKHFATVSTARSNKPMISSNQARKLDVWHLLSRRYQCQWSKKVPPIFITCSASATPVHTGLHF